MVALRVVTASGDDDLSVVSPQNLASFRPAAS